MGNSNNETEKQLNAEVQTLRRRIIELESFVDVTGHNQAENALRESAEQYHAITATAMDGFWVLNLEGHLLDVNEAYCRMIGYSRRELLAMSVSDVEVEENPDEIRVHVQKNMETGADRFETRHRCKDGRIIDVEISTTLIHQPGRILSFLRDITERKQVETRLRENENLLRESQDVAGLGSYVLDIPGGFWKSSAVLDKLFGIDKEFERSVEGWASLIHPDDRAMMVDYFSNEVVGKGRRFDKKYRIVRYNDHVERQVHGLGRLEFDAQGFPVKMYGTIQDISERERAEEAVQESEAAFRELTNSITDVFFAMDDDLRYVYWNKASEVLTGIPAENALGKSIFEIFPDTPALRRAVEVYRDTLATQQPRSFMTDNTLRGEHYFFEINAYPSKRGVSVFVKDVTEHRRAERALRESERKYRLLFENMTAGFALHEMIYDEQGRPIDYRFLEINPAFENLTGVSASMLLGKTAKEALPGTEQYWIDTYGRVAQTGEPTAYENFSSEMNKYYEVWAFSPAQNQFAVVFTDVTERTRAEKELAHYREHLEELVEQRTAELHAANEQLVVLSRMKDEFVSNVSHELRTPITSLKLREELLERHPERLPENLTVIMRETERLDRTIEDLLLLSRLDQRRTEVSLAPVDLNEVVSQYAADRALIAQAKNQTLSFSGESGLPEVVADRGLLGQALSILLTNAINYTPAGGHLSLETHSRQCEDTQWVGFSVSDTGPGISPEEQSRLFSRFFRGSVGRKSRVPGTGLGLAIAKAMVEQHQGQIEVESDGVAGHGTTFKVWIPLKQP